MSLSNKIHSAEYVIDTLSLKNIHAPGKMGRLERLRGDQWMDTDLAHRIVNGGRVRVCVVILVI